MTGTLQRIGDRERLVDKEGRPTLEFQLAWQALVEAIEGKQDTSETLDALGAYDTDGLLTQTASNTFTGREIVGPAAGLSISDGDGIAGNPTIALDNDLEALEAISGTNVIPFRSGTDAWSTVPYVATTSFTPLLQFGGGSTGMTFAANGQLGRYLRIGAIVFFQVRFVLTAKGSSTGDATIESLPIAAAAQPESSGKPRCNNMTTVSQVGWRIIATGTRIELVDMGTGTAVSLTDADFTNTSSVILSGFYFV